MWPYARFYVKPLLKHEHIKAKLQFAMPSYPLCYEANGSKTIPQNKQPEEQIVEGIKPSCFLFQNILLWQSYIQHTFFIMWLYATYNLQQHYAYGEGTYYLLSVTTKHTKHFSFELEKELFLVSSVWCLCMLISSKCGSI